MGWFIGYAVGIGVVAVVVVILVVLIALARRIGGKAEAIVSALEDAEEQTSPLWEVAETNATVERITRDAATARMVLEAEGDGR